MTSQSGRRLNQYLSALGLCSRREADRLIADGKVRINGRPAELGTRVNPGDKVTLNGRLVTPQQGPAPVYIAFHKPRGIVCTTDTREPDNIIDYIDYPERIFPIGRLDKDSSGLILLTNDGDIVNRILRARYGHEKEYIVRVNRPVTPRFLRQMEGGVHILGTVTRPCRCRRISDNEFRITLTQGLNRQIRRMCEALGYKVIRLKRIRIMHITLGNLPEGYYRELGKKELRDLETLLKSGEAKAAASQSAAPPIATKNPAPQPEPGSRSQAPAPELHAGSGTIAPTPEPHVRVPDQHTIIQVAAGILSTADGRLLISRRPDDKHCGGRWEFPGGKIETGETPADCLRRECREELGIELQDLQIYEQVQHRYPDRGVHLYFYKARIIDGESAQAREGQSIALVSQAELGSYAFCEADNELIRRLVDEAAKS